MGKIAEELRVEFLKEYFKRNLSHFSSDKRGFGWRIRQRGQKRASSLFIAAQHFLCEESIESILSQCRLFFSILGRLRGVQ